MFCIFSGVAKTCRSAFCVASTTARSPSYRPQSQAATLLGMCRAMRLPADTAIRPWTVCDSWRTPLALSIEVRGYTVI
jgi:hypothetical protein